MIIPELIDNLSDGIIDLKYKNSRFTESKKKLKEAYDTYVEELDETLKQFAKDISSRFQQFNDKWSVKFEVPKKSEGIRDLISNDVKLSIDDTGSIGIADKGAGLQRLASILLYFEMISRISKGKKSNIICIDEPDAYLHEGLQHKLKELFDSKNDKAQLFITTHSRVFINEYNLNNVFLLDANYSKQFFKRKGREISLVETYLVNISEDDGYDKISNHLGLIRQSGDVLNKNNLLVEGECDRKYISELMKFFDIKVPNIIVANGADNIPQYLEFYNSFYNKNPDIKPNLKIILDNDEKGRNIYKKIVKKKYNSINVSLEFIPNSTGTIFDETVKNANIEIEDFVYPELIVVLINEILVKKELNKLNGDEIVRLLSTKAFERKGILNLCENEKNRLNPEEGILLTVDSVQFKEAIAKMLEIKGNKRLIDMLTKYDKRNSFVKEYLSNLSSFGRFKKS